jgi:hypothetical protein
MYKLMFNLPDEEIILAYDDVSELPNAATADVAAKTSCYPT